MPPIGHRCLSMSCLSILLAVVVVVLGIMVATFGVITSRGFLPITVRTALNSVPLFNSRQHYAFSHLPDNLTGTTILITGASSGIGHEAAKLMAERGARVVLGTRGSRARLKSIENSLGPGVAAPSSLDLASFSSIREFVRSLSDLGVERIDSALLNAAKMSFGYEEGELGIERMMAGHHLGHAYLLELLMPLMLASQRPRVVFVSSSAHVFSYAEGIRFNSTAGSFGLYFQAYASSKLANAVYVRALASRLEAAYPSKFVVNAVNPGVVTTPFAWYQLYVPSLFSATPREGALSVLSPLLDSEAQTDGYYDPLGLRLDWYHDTAYWWTCDADLRERLWQWTSAALRDAHRNVSSTPTGSLILDRNVL
ncbi:hypothetical protein FOZ63_019256 [Perkinsus olseni]|uniref:Dehydrogenase/reductase SDR member 12 n=1 Tax=Perkinsus olseni TaxID=32597 RepID=A0A7J6S316_PEROL|nr:hypothetical protein FOZ63_019256 [Perkinsus olseni]